MRVAHLGLVPYGEALALQRGVAQARIDGRLDDDVLLLLEHPPVITMGRGAHAGNLLASSTELAARGVEVFEVERGGDVTLHAPGQLVGYPIFALDRGTHRPDLHWYLRQVEAALIEALAVFGVDAVRRVGYTGVWTGRRGSSGAGAPSGASRPPVTSAAGGDASVTRKIASIGVHVRKWVTWHGFALNVSTDLSLFDLIVPCGIDGVTMTSLAREVGAPGPSVERVAREVTAAFAGVFRLEADGVPAGTLRELTSSSIAG